MLTVHNVLTNTAHIAQGFVQRVVDLQQGVVCVIVHGGEHLLFCAVVTISLAWVVALPSNSEAWFCACFT